MSSSAVQRGGALGEFALWLREKVDRLEAPFEDEKGLEREVSQSALFSEDVRGGSHTLSQEAPFRLASLAQRLSVVVAAPFAFFVEVYWLCRGEINGSTWLLHLSLFPLQVGGASLLFFKELVSALRESGKSIVANVGFFAWHVGEWTVNWIRENSTTVLSNERATRKGVYEGIGTTLLAAGALFVPVAAVQLAALPILFGSLFGILHHGLGVRNCPQYYTVDHSYDGEELRLHPVRTNHWLVKPLVVGCSAVGIVTKLTGVALGVVGAIPYAAMALPLSWAAVLIGGVYTVALITAQIFAAVKKRSIESDLEAYRGMVGGWGEDDRWHAVDRRAGGDSQSGEQGAIARRIQDRISNGNVPLRLMAAWEANRTRDQVGGYCAQGGALVAAVATVFLRIFAL